MAVQPVTKFINMLKMKLQNLTTLFLSLLLLASGYTYAGNQTEVLADANSKFKSYSIRNAAAKAPGDTVYFEDFNSGAFPSDYIFFNADQLTPFGTYDALFNDSAWAVVNWVATPDPVATSVSWYSPVGQANDWMIIPIVLPNAPTELKWDASASDNPPFNDGYDVYVATSADTNALLSNPVFTTPAEQGGANFVERTVNFASLGLADDTVYVGFRNRTFNGNLLFIDNILVTELANTAEVQIIHNSADLAAGLVDIYLDSTLALDSVPFQAATPFLTVPDSFSLQITPAGAGIGGVVYNTDVVLVPGEKYVAIASGIVSSTGYSPAPAFDIFAAGGKTRSDVAGNTEVLIFHGATDAPTVTVNEMTVPVTLEPGFDFGDFNSAGYLNLPNRDFLLEVTDSAGVSLYYQAPLQSLGLADSALVVVASGFVDPSQNSNGAPFGLYAILPSGGGFIPLPQVTTSELQIIHNSADLAAEFVDIYIDSVLALDSVAFQTATPYLTVPANFSVQIAPAGAGIGGVVYDTDVNLIPSFQYVAVAAGIVSATGYSPAPAFDIFASAGRTQSIVPGNTDLLVFHGATDAPTVAVNELTIPGTIEPGFDFGEFNSAGFLSLPNADYVIEVTDSAGVQLYYGAPLQTLGLADSALVVLASGFVDPSQNSNGAPFGVFAVLPGGGAFIPLPLLSNPRVQVIHNSADAAANVVDVYLNGGLALDSVAYKTATGYLEVPHQFSIDIAPFGAGIGSSVFDADISLLPGEDYVVIASGIVSATGYNPAPPFGLSVFAGGLDASETAGNASVLIYHGATDAPQVAVNEITLPTTLEAGFSYGEFNDAGYLDLPVADYTLEVSDSATVQLYYGAPLQTLGLADSAFIVLASGFVNPSANSNGEAFGLFAVLASGGDFIPLPNIASPAVQIIHNSADAAAADVDIFVNDNPALTNVMFRQATGYISLPHEFVIDIAPAGSGIGSSVYNANIALEPGETYVVVANGIVSASGYSPATPFDLDVFAGGREISANAGETDVLIYHGSTDAPTVDVNETSVPAGNLATGLSYGDFTSDYLELATADYIVEVTDNGAISLEYEAPLSTLNLTDSAIVVLASGFVDPSVNSNGPGFGLWAALASGGALVELPLVVGLDNELVISEVSVFPNPANDVMSIEIGDLIVSEIRIVNILGQAQKSIEINSQIMENVNVSDLEAGTYFVQIISDKGIGSIPVIIR